MRLLPAAAGAPSNVLLLPSVDRHVFNGLRVVDRVPHVALSQVVLDCLGGTGRMPAEGEAVISTMSRTRRPARSQSRTLEPYRSIDSLPLNRAAREDDRWRTSLTTSMRAAKSFKLGKRLRTPDRLNDKDASDVFGLMSAYCAEIVALTYQAMGLLPAERPPSWYDPGRFWSGDDLQLTGAARLGAEISVQVPPPAAPASR